VEEIDGFEGGFVGGVGMVVGGRFLDGGGQLLDELCYQSIGGQV